MKKSKIKGANLILGGFSLLLMLIIPPFIMDNRIAGIEKGIEVYFMSKREGYYGLYRSNLKTTEMLFNSKELLEKFPNKAKYQIAYDISWDGRFLVFHAMSKKGNMDIFLIDLESNNVKNLTDNTSTDTQPVFSNNGEWIAYLSHEIGGKYYDNIFITSRDGRIKKRLTMGFFNIISLTFSPDDREILYVKYLPFHSAISLLNIESGIVKDLTSFSYSNRTPTFDGEGNRIVYSSDYHGSFDIWIMDRDGSNNRLLYESPGMDYDPRFTRDGKKVIFVSDFIVNKYKDRIGTSIFLIDTDGKTLYNLLPRKFLQKDFFFFYPRLIGDDNLLYFQGKKVEGNKKSYYTIYIEDLKKTRVTKLIKDRFNNTEPYIILK